ncbi:hypothetical protein BO70DRAFT_297344 [Aspergillus heteromorphus CBS 117.55]|uniref:Uncharacterized protein n=1 Tax=Aspergillus heteromorphus CBS 117.55 TaxID=1448321 RepID=A0A317VMC3_9EURO|nr:uncharacterized protein BO70DRAFT_297344 [Aspergillus heteromorphus CBS 117.55]PWY73050.1 hypothetical protein BO70DRAFT_297344 [Aspergillus heteromorphus CBS 117.55]
MINPPSFPQAHSVEDLYASGGKGSLRYVFLHGNHARPNLPTHACIEGKVRLFNRQGDIVFDDDPTRASSQYGFTEGRCVSVNDQPDAYIPARMFVQTLLKNIQVPGLIAAEVPKAILVTGRSGLDPIPAQDRDYLESMMQRLVPRFVSVISGKSDAYLPGDAKNLCHEIADSMLKPRGGSGDLDLLAFLDVYEKRYIHKPSATPEAILESCLLHVMKMPFELNSSIRYRLITD